MSTDFRALCEELTTTLEYTWDGRRPKVIQELIERARAVLACYGTPANEPVPVSERLPEPEDLDGDGRCWWWHPDHKEDDFDDGWILLNPKWAGSRRAQAVLDAFTGNDTIHGLHLMTPRLAAALRAAADQVVPEEANAVGDEHDGARHDQWMRIRYKLLAIAAELEA